MKVWSVEHYYDGWDDSVLVELFDSEKKAIKYAEEYATKTASYLDSRAVSTNKYRLRAWGLEGTDDYIVVNKLEVQ